ncbi:UNVERIFIED_CONTAM: hypothetical protein GTU68_066127 [Idotea baltica]|nr:hypothetical protein [Idotea baltica]
MKIHEYQGKDLFRAAGVPVPRGIVCKSADEVAAAYTELGGSLAVVKSQIHAGGRGKGRFKEHPDQAGVVLVRSADEAKENAERMLGQTLVTIQTGLDIANELYLGVVVDREVGGPAMILSSEGGMAIEDVAHDTPELIKTVPFSMADGLTGAQARAAAESIGLTGKAVDSAEDVLPKICKFFVDNDCDMAEINPLVVTGTDEIVALDAKVSFDGNALFRHKDFEALRDLSEEEPAEIKAQEAGLSYVKLDGNIGCLVNGAGLAMSTMDLIQLHGGEPANFLDVGGGAKVEAVTEAFRIILGDKNVKAVLVNIFGGIMQCDVIVEALLVAYDKVGFHVPLVVRLEGTNVEIARDMLEKCDKPIITATDLTDAAQKVVGSLSA